MCSIRVVTWHRWRCVVNGRPFLVRFITMGTGTFTMPLVAHRMRIPECVRFVRNHCVRGDPSPVSSFSWRSINANAIHPKSPRGTRVMEALREASLSLRRLHVYHPVDPHRLWIPRGLQTIVTRHPNIWTRWYAVNNGGFVTIDNWHTECDRIASHLLTAIRDTYVLSMRATVPLSNRVACIAPLVADRTT